jgi:DegV family protein with EDD domain
MTRKADFMSQPRVAVVTDSISCLTRELVQRYEIEVIPVNFYAEGKIYKDWVDVTPSEAYELFLKDPESFKTSSVYPIDCLKAYRKVSQRAQEIVCVTVSAGLSAVYTVVNQAKEQIKAELPQLKIEMVDSKTATAAEGFVALAAARTAAAGKSLAEAVVAAEEVRKKVTVLAMLDTIRHVYRSGRIPKVAAQAASVLNIKPILSISQGGIRFEGAVRSRERGIKRMLKTLKTKAGQKPLHIAVMHAYALEEAQKLMERLRSEFNCVELWLTEFSPVMGYATGTGTIGFAFYVED